MIKFEHSLFALPFAYLGLFLGENGWPRFFLFFWVTIAMVSFRTMAMALNRLIDLPIDAENPRTQDRALPKRRLSLRFVWVIAFLAWALFELSAFQLGPLCFKLSLIPVALAWLYPWTKRFTWFSHFVLGIILGIAPYGAWLASRGNFSWIPGLLTLGVVDWVAGFDIIYALQDVEFDRKNHLHSIPAALGEKASLRIVQLFHGLAILAWLAAGWLAGLGWIYTIGIIFVTLFLLRENWLIRSFGLTRLNEAFFTMNAIVSISLFVLTVADLSLRSVMS
jgi:4-hydroxybenzoate polyprenyltransferase